MQVRYARLLEILGFRWASQPRALFQGGVPKGTSNDGPLRVGAARAVHNTAAVSLDYCWKRVHRDLGGQGERDPQWLARMHKRRAKSSQGAVSALLLPDALQGQASWQRQSVRGRRFWFKPGGDVNDSINCILKNLTEMNNLWIRMQGNKEKSKREKERVDLKITVGENLSRLSKLQGVNKEIYLN